MRNDDDVDDTVSCSPPPSPLDSMVIDSDHSPPSASVHVHTPSPTTRLSIETWTEGGDERRRRRWKEEKFSLVLLNYDTNGMMPVSYKKFSSVFRGSPLAEQH